MGVIEQGETSNALLPEQFGKYMRDDIAKWTKVAKERHIELTD
jgi:hypothetical protein